ncbi:MAG: hypothetical protein IPH13_11475 [Planctomycetes bacterium]|nr:hypothetical protein [Planctomycetota bacterium]MCC7169190.1 hypothetical protein [Planctomycetota bacterium]
MTNRRAVVSRSFVLRFAAATAALVLASLVVARIVFDSRTYDIEYTVPADRTRLVARYVAAHSHLAEYDRSLIVVRTNGARDEVELAKDTGGYSRAQLYEADDGALYLEGFFDVARIDANSRRISVSSNRVPAGARYLGAFDRLREGGWKFLAPHESPEQSLAPRGG